MKDLLTNPDRRREVLRRWRERVWTIRALPVYPSSSTFPSPTLYPGALSVSAAQAVTGFGPSATAMRLQVEADFDQHDP